MLARVDSPTLPVSRPSDRREVGVATAQAAAVGGVGGARPPDPARARPARRFARIGLAVAVVALLVGSATVAVRTPPPGLRRRPRPPRAPRAVRPRPARARSPPLRSPRPPRSTCPGCGSAGHRWSTWASTTRACSSRPASIAVAGWFTGSAVPGEVGPTVIAGHVDSYDGPRHLLPARHAAPRRPRLRRPLGRRHRALPRHRRGDRAQGRVPHPAVYGPTPGPELRLITCGGEFDHSARRYLRNVVVSGGLRRRLLTPATTLGSPERARAR